MSTAWDIPLLENGEERQHLSASMVYEWAIKQKALSKAFTSGCIKMASLDDTTRDSYKIMVMKVHDTLRKRSNLTEAEIKRRMVEVSEHLEDPGLLENFYYFDVPSSDFMLMFYFAVWDRRIAEVMGYLHNYGKDLMGVTRMVPKDDIWYQMSRYEGMNINERKKAMSVVDFIEKNNVRFATSFGGGNIPERLYGLPEDLILTVFDDGPISSLEELFPEQSKRERVVYYRESLVQSLQHTELKGTQDLVYMHGVSMYLDESRSEMSNAILCGLTLLRDGGYMKYDYLVWNDSMRRVVATQNWPYDPRHPMTVFNNALEAIETGRETIGRIDGKLAYIELLDPVLTLVEPWGVTSVRFTIKKHTF